MSLIQDHRKPRIPVHSSLTGFALVRWALCASVCKSLIWSLGSPGHSIKTLLMWQFIIFVIIDPAPVFLLLSWNCFFSHKLYEVLLSALLSRNIWNDKRHFYCSSNIICHPQFRNQPPTAQPLSHTHSFWSGFSFSGNGKCFQRCLWGMLLNTIST